MPADRRVNYITLEAADRVQLAAKTYIGGNSKVSGKKKPVSQDVQQFDFEEALGQLEALVSAMEEGELSLEESLQAFEKGVKLTRECQTALENAEQKVQTLLDDSGTGEPLNFDDDEKDVEN